MELNKTDINIEKYILGELSEEALNEFEAQIEKDEALQKKVNFYQYSDSVLYDKLSRKKDTNDVNAEFIANLDKLGNKYFPKEVANELNPTTEEVQELTTGKPPIIKRLLPFATLAAAAALLVFLFLPGKNNKLYENFFEPEKLISQQSLPDNTSNFEKANELYKSENYKEAKVLYEKSLIEKPNDAWALVYKGCSEMELNQINQAVSSFQQLADQHNDFADIANWYLALCHLKKGDAAQSTNLLKRISKNDKHYEKARQLLKEL